MIKILKYINDALEYPIEKLKQQFVFSHNLTL